MAQEVISTRPASVDEFYLSSVIVDEGPGQQPPLEEAMEENLQVSDAEYAEELQFQEALMWSVIVSQMRSTVPSPSSLTIVATDPVLKVGQDDDDDDDDGEKMEEAEKEEEKMEDEAPMCMEIIQAEPAGESSLSFCEICVERKEIGHMFKTEGCVHSFCSDCIGKHVATKVQERVSAVTCPGLDCRAVLELDTCRTVLSKGVIDLWEDALCEKMINGSRKFYCPFKDCSALLVDDGEGEETITESECPFCHRLFCAGCYVAWHPGVNCEEFMRLNEDERGREDLMVIELAKDKKWSRCPQCKYFVERTEGCPHITCRCNFEFCYGCGAEWTETHVSCPAQ